jgi:cellulose synthase/poly-beta-1,6-N-acetylglucosamine synthase-like glycosyltransferase
MLDLSFITIPASAIMIIVTTSWIIFLLSSLFFRVAPNAKAAGSTQPFFSVIIPAHNEERVIARTVQCFLNQTYQSLEVIVICHNCSDHTFHKAKQIGDSKLKVINLKTPKSGKALALNEGLKHSHGNIVLQMDADNLVDSDFVSKLATQYFDNPKTLAVQVSVSTKNPMANLLTKFQELEYELFGISYWKGRNLLGFSCTIGGTGVAFRREVLEQVGGWDNELIEDYDLYCKFSQNGIKVTYANDVHCYDEKPPYWSAMIVQRARWIKGHFQVAKKRLVETSSIFDLIYMTSPLFYIAWYSTALLFGLYLLLEQFGISLSFWYPPPYVWLSFLIAIYSIFIYHLIAKKRYVDLLYLPIYFLFSFHWLIAFLYCIRIKTWAQAKTEHGYVTT